MGHDVLKEMLYRIADDLLILGHRNSEWTGMGPLLEEDIAFSSMAQDKLGQSQALYIMLHELGEREPDQSAFMRSASAFRNCIFTELPNGEYDFSLVRHFLFDTALALRFEMLTTSRFQPLAGLALKIRGELKYHTLHANSWIQQLATATGTSVQRLQQSLDFALPYALGIFETTPHDTGIIEQGWFAGEELLMARWKQKVQEVLSSTRLKLPPWTSVEPVTGGRSGTHSEHLQPLLDEMSEVFRTDPTAEW